MIAQLIKIKKKWIKTDSPDWNEWEDGQIVRYSLRQFYDNKGNLQNYLLKIDDLEMINNIMGIEGDENRRRLVEEIEKINLFNKKNREKLMKEITLFELIKFKLK